MEAGIYKVSFLFFFDDLSMTFMKHILYLRKENCMEVVDFRTKTRKKEEFRQKMEDILQKGKEWVIENKEIVVVLAPVIIHGITVITKTVYRGNCLRKEKQLRTLYCYDRSVGNYWRLKRPLSNREWMEVSIRKGRGENLGYILSSMRVLK